MRWASLQIRRLRPINRKLGKRIEICMESLNWKTLDKVEYFPSLPIYLNFSFKDGGNAFSVFIFPLSKNAVIRKVLSRQDLN